MSDEKEIGMVIENGAARLARDGEKPDVFLFQDAIHAQDFPSVNRRISDLSRDLALNFDELCQRQQIYADCIDEMYRQLDEMRSELQTVKDKLNQ